MGNIIDGLHLLVDGIVSDSSAFTVEMQEKMLEEIVAACGMQLIFGPVSKEVDVDPKLLTGDEFVDEGGVSSFCMLGTSHASIHSWPLRKVFMLDVFSCRDFDAQKVINIIKLYMKPKSINVQRIYRNPLISS